MWESVGDDVFGVRNVVVKGWVVFFKEKTPAKNTLSCAAAEFMSEVLVVSVDMKNGTKKRWAELFEGFDDRKEFFFIVVSFFWAELSFCV